MWSPAALLDVKRLYDFLKPKNLDAAKRAVKAIRQGVKVLEKHSGVGRPVEDMEDEFRDWIIDFFWGHKKSPWMSCGSRPSFAGWPT